MSDKAMMNAGRLIREGQTIIAAQGEKIKFLEHWNEALLSIVLEIRPRDCNCNLCLKADATIKEYHDALKRYGTDPSDS